MARIDDPTTEVRTRPPPLPQAVLPAPSAPVVIDPHVTRFSAPLAVTWGILVFVALAGAYAGSEFRALKTQIETISAQQAKMLTKPDLEQFKNGELQQLFQQFLGRYDADCVPNPSLGRGHQLCVLRPKETRVP